MLRGLIFIFEALHHSTPRHINNRLAAMGLNKPQSEAPTDKPRPEAAATAPQRTYIQTETHEWTPFELDAVLALVCRHRHRQPLLTFATELNEALNGANRNFDDDIPTADVSQFLEHLQKTRKYACELLLFSFFSSSFLLAFSFIRCLFSCIGGITWQERSMVCLSTVMYPSLSFLMVSRPCPSRHRVSLHSSALTSQIG